MDKCIRHARSTNEDTSMDDPDSTKIQQPVLCCVQYNKLFLLNILPNALVLGSYL